MLTRSAWASLPISMKNPGSLMSSLNLAPVKTKIPSLEDVRAPPTLIGLRSLLGRIVADQVDSVLPDLTPHVHAFADVHGAAHFIGCGPDNLERDTGVKRVIKTGPIFPAHPHLPHLVQVVQGFLLPGCSVCTLIPSISRGTMGYIHGDMGRCSL